MTLTLRRIALGSLLTLGVIGFGSVGTPPSASAQGCDPSYPEVCLGAYPDLDCIDIGYPITVIHDPAIGAYDPHALDADFDGIGCESSWCHRRHFPPEQNRPSSNGCPGVTRGNRRDRISRDGLRPVIPRLL